MSLTGGAWLLMFVTFAVLSLTRPVYGVCLYMMTFFALPVGWWWGKGLIDSLAFGRWSLFAALIFVVAVAASESVHKYRLDKTAKTVFTVLFIYAINATIVHYLFASNVTRSYNNLELLWKYIGLTLLIYFAITNIADFKVAFYAIIGGAFYVAWEIVVNERGTFEKGRLEGIFIPGAGDSNYLAALMALCIPLAAGVLFSSETWRGRIFAFVSLPYIFDVILRCNSRGTFLALIAGGGVLVIASTGRMRRYAMYGAILTLLAVVLQAKDPEIAERFFSIFVASTERDPAAKSRIEFWKAGLKMIGDYPLGSGGEAAFKSNRGSPYIRKIYSEGRYRAVHNGYIDVAAGWGVQGFFLYMLAIWLAWRKMRRAIKYNRDIGNSRISFLGVCIESALVTQLVACFFISSLDGEWFFWVMAIMLKYGVLYSPVELDADTAVGEQQAVQPQQPPQAAVAG